MDPQTEVREFIDANDLHTEPAYRVLDLVSEVGEVAKNVNTSTNYGTRAEAASIDETEVGDVLFATYALAEEAGIDAESALQQALDKYRNRIADTSNPGSGAE